MRSKSCCCVRRGHGSGSMRGRGTSGRGLGARCTSCTRGCPRGRARARDRESVRPNDWWATIAFFPAAPFALKFTPIISRLTVPPLQLALESRRDCRECRRDCRGCPSGRRHSGGSVGDRRCGLRGTAVEAVCRATPFLLVDAPAKVGVLRTSQAIVGGGLRRREASLGVTMMAAPVRLVWEPMSVPPMTETIKTIVGRRRRGFRTTQLSLCVLTAIRFLLLPPRFLPMVIIVGIAIVGLVVRGCRAALVEVVATPLFFRLRPSISGQCRTCVAIEEQSVHSLASPATVLAAVSFLGGAPADAPPGEARVAVELRRAIVAALVLVLAAHAFLLG